MSAARDFPSGYAPGGVTRKAKARRNGRAGGIASGVKRRQLAKGRRPRPRTRDEALALAYRHRQLRRRQFEELYAEHFPRPERPSAAVAWERGRSACWEFYLGLWRLYRARGQHCATTKPRRARGMKRRGVPRCKKTVQRMARKVEAMGLAQLSHYKDQRDTPGAMDHLVLEIRTPPMSHVPLLRRTKRDFVPELGSLPATTSVSAASRQRSRAPTALECAASRLMTSAPAAPEGSTEEAGPAAAELAYQRARQLAGFSYDAELVAELELKLAGCSGQCNAATCSSTTAGLR